MFVRTTSPDRRGIGEMTIGLRRDGHADVECEVTPKERHPVASNQLGGGPPPSAKRCVWRRDAGATGSRGVTSGSG